MQSPHIEFIIILEKILPGWAHLCRKFNTAYKIVYAGRIVCEQYILIFMKLLEIHIGASQIQPYYRKPVCISL